MKSYDPEKRSNLNTDSFEELDGAIEGERRIILVVSIIKLTNHPLQTGSNNLLWHY